MILQAHVYIGDYWHLVKDSISLNQMCREQVPAEPSSKQTSRFQAIGDDMRTLRQYTWEEQVRQRSVL